LRSYGGLKSEKVKKIKNLFLVKTTPYGKISKNSVPNVFIATSINMLCSNFVKFSRQEIGEIVSCLRENNKTKLCLALQLSLLRGPRPKSATASPQQHTQSAPDFIQIGSLYAEL